MAEFFLHLRGEMDETFDPEGIELPDLEAVKQTALKAAREIMAHDAIKGTIDLNQRIEVEDSHGEVVYVLRLADAVRIISH